MTSDGLRAQAQIYQHIAIRDLPKRYASLFFMLYACWTAGFTTASLVILGSVTTLELIGYLVIRCAPKVGNTSIARLVVYLSNGFVLASLYHAPAVVLTFQPDFGLFTLGVLWTLAGLAASSTMYHALPVFFWSVTIPGFIASFTVLSAGFRVEFASSATESWILAIGFLCLHVANTVRLLWDFRDTHQELDTTRAQSLVRLRRLEHLSTHDGLTNLLNRTAFEAELARHLEAATTGQPVAVILIDLNSFKPINDTYGHDAGDAVIITVARRLAKIGGETVVVARLGGDEFAMIVPPGMTAAAVHGYANAIAAHVREPILYKTAVVRISASVGIAFSDDTLTRATEICAAADQAMYRAKASADDAPVQYRADMFAPRPSLEDKNRIAAALRMGEIGPHYQMKIAIETGEICGFEALARWQHPDRGLLAPGHFIDDISNLGLMPDLTYWMLRQVLADVSGWLAEGLNPGRVAVNIPEITLATPAGREDLDWLLAEHEHCRGHITFEITEDVVIARSGDAIKHTIEHFARSGVAISLDDFGTGFASFRHLQELTFDEMKIDTSFVAGLGTDPVTDVIVEGFMSIARGLGVDITAEGVETEAQLAHLRQLGCTYAQGYFFSKAVPVTEARSQMLNRAKTSRSA